MRYLRTSDVARAVGPSVNTVRRYVDRGLLPPVERTPKGYRRFTQRHVDCLRVVRLVHMEAYPGRAIRRSGLRIVKAAVAGDWQTALEMAHQHLAKVGAELRQAHCAVESLEQWVSAPAGSGPSGLRVGEAARSLGVSIDM